VKLLCGKLVEGFSDSTSGVPVMLHLNAGIGDTVEIAAVVGSAGAEFASDGPAGDVGEEPSCLEFRGITLTLGTASHRSSKYRV
jgi:hypothetical protein